MHQKIRQSFRYLRCLPAIQQSDRLDRLSLGLLSLYVTHGSLLASALMIGSMKPRALSQGPRDHRRLQPVSPREQPICVLHATRGRPAFVSIGVFRCARRAGSIHWTFVIEHSLSCHGSRKTPRGVSRTLQAGPRRVKSATAVVRSARPRRGLCQGRCSCRRLYISIVSDSHRALPGRNKTPVVYLRRCLLFDSKIEQLRAAPMSCRRKFR
jgi:hypothetical protein